ncbi:MAG: hypothetical protein LBR06_04155 [Bacteroidales bacterium]|jgi:hypothetical protein|nr:hypothetical protein [Bacteroidales bacterium]
MDELTKKLDRLRDELARDEASAKEAVTRLRTEGYAESIPVVIDLLLSTESVALREHIVEFLSDLKDGHAIPYIVDAIKAPEYGKIRGYLLEACWANGLDYSSFLPVFIDVAVTAESFGTAFEAHTVITNMSGCISRANISDAIDRLNAAIRANPEDRKTPLWQNLVEYFTVEDAEEIDG